MADMKIHLGRAAIGGDSGSRWDVPLRAVDNGDGTFSMSVKSEGAASSGEMSEIKALLVDIKAELVALNVNLTANNSVDIL